MKKFPIPAELKLEGFERLKQTSTFHRLDLAIEFIAGHNNIGAVVKRFTDAIHLHDEIVKRIEEMWKQIDELRRVFNTKNRLFRNMDSAWTLLNHRPDDFSEYLLLRPKMKNIDERIKKITDTKAKIKAEADRSRFIELEPICSNLSIAYAALEGSRRERDISREALVAAETAFNRLRDEEKRMSSLISDDHIIADEKLKTVQSLHPNVLDGLVLKAINGNDVEYLGYEEIVKTIAACASPHVAEFLRYDHRYDPFNGLWKSLQQLRDMGVCIDDPMIQNVDFVSCASRGDEKAIRMFITRGSDPNSVDYTGCTPLMAAAAGGHFETVKTLLSVKAKVDARDKNMMTPLLVCISRGNLDMAKLLIKHKADLNCSDRNGRGSFYYALGCGRVEVVHHFIKPNLQNLPDKLWGFTPLHVAANQGNGELVQYLLTSGCSIFQRCKKGKTAEDIATECGHTNIAKILENNRLQAPAQLVLRLPDIEVEVWIGDLTALDPVFVADVGFTEVVCIMSSSERPANMSWVIDDAYIKFFVREIEGLDDSDSSGSWDSLVAHFAAIVAQLMYLFKRGGVTILICDPTGNSTCAAILAAFMLVKAQTRIKETLDLCCAARESVSLSLSFRRGLDSLQRDFDEKKIKRLRNRVRVSAMMSTQF